MPKIDVKPIVLRNVLCTVAADDYAKHVSGVTLTPTTGSVSWSGMDPDASFTFPTSTTWAAQLDYAQDWDTTDSLSAYLFDHEGDKVTMTFRPEAGGPGFEVEVFIVPGSIGGQINAVATSSVTLGVVGKPQRVAAA